MRRLLLKIIRRRHLHADLQEELAFHREQARIDHNPVPLGNAARITEDALDLWRFTFIENLWRDVVYGVRGLRRSRGLVASAILSLGLGIGVNTAIFSLAAEMLLSRPAVTDPASIVGIRLSSSHAAREVVDFVRASGIFRDVAGENEETFVNWDTGRETRRIFAVAVTKNYFAALGVPVALGRGIVPQDPDEVVVLRHEFWRTHFNGDPGVIGRTMRLEGRPYSVIGVLPPAQRTLVGLGFSPDVYVPSYLPDTALAMYGRLEPGMSLGEARARMQTIASRLDSVSPREYRYADAVQVSPVAGIARVRGKLLPVALFFVVLLTIVALVLLVACVNVAGLLLARASARRQEMAIRLAIGASRGRLVQQLLVESLLLASLGAAFGLVLARLAGDAAGRIQLPLPVPLRLHMDIDWRVAAYAAAITVLAACATGLLPAWQTVQEAIAPDLQRHRRIWVRKTLIIGQVAVSVVIVATAGLFVRNLVAANEISPGFDVVHTLRAEVNLPAAAYRSPEAIAAYVDRMLPALTSVPGITQAAAARIVPFTDGITNTNTLTFTNEPGEVHARFHWNAVTPAYFDVLAIPLLQGRAFAESDRAGERVVIVNRAFVARYRSGRSPLGSVFRWGGDTEPHRIVGVVGNTKNMTVGEDDEPQIYQPLAQTVMDRRRLQFVLRAATPPALQVEPVRHVLRQSEPSAATEVATLYSSIGLAFLPSQLGAAVLGSLGVLALVLTAIGLSGTMAYTVARRIPEIGVRMALGATRRDVLRLVLREAIALVGAGAIIGMVVALIVTRPLAIFLVSGLAASDPITFALVLAVLTLTAAVASWGPVRRAARVEPVTALRYE